MSRTLVGVVHVGQRVLVDPQFLSCALTLVNRSARVVLGVGATASLLRRAVRVDKGLAAAFHVVEDLGAEVRRVRQLATLSIIKLCVV